MSDSGLGPDPPPEPHPRPDHRGAGFWLSAAAGWALIGWGVRGAVDHRLDTRPPDLARFFVAGVAVHDLLFAPLVLVAGVAVGRLAPRRWRSHVQGALIVSGVLALFAYPEVRGFAHGLNNPTSLPHNYAANLILVVATVWLGAAVMAVVSVARARRSTSRGGGR